MTTTVEWVSDLERANSLEVPCQMMVFDLAAMGWLPCDHVAEWLIYIRRPCGHGGGWQHFMCDDCKVRAIDEGQLILCSVNCDRAVELRHLERIA